MKNKFLYKLFRQIGWCEAPPKQLEKQKFRKNVELILDKKKDFSCLYDYDKICNFNQTEEIIYLKNLTKNYLDVEQNILKERLM